MPPDPPPAEGQGHWRLSGSGPVQPPAAGIMHYYYLHVLETKVDDDRHFLPFQPLNVVHVEEWGPVVGTLLADLAVSTPLH